jgi:hypothetical protein
MSALTNLEGSDTVFVGSLDFDLNGPSQINPGHRHKSNICATKLPGKRSFKLNSVNDLGIDQPYDFDIEFDGQTAGFDLNGDELIRWDVNQPINRDFATSGITVHLDDAIGSILTVIRGHNPRTQGKDCGGNDRSIGVDLQSQPGNNSLKITGSTSFGTSVNISADNISLIADGRDQFSINARINVVRNECGIGGVVPGGTARFWAQVNDVPIGDIVMYEWSVSGAAPIGASDQYDFKVQLGNDATAVEVMVVITLEGISQAIVLNYLPDTEQSVRVKQLICEVMGQLRVNFLVDPLWDPLRDYVTRPLGRSELQRIEQFTKALHAKVAALLRIEAAGAERNK